MKPILFKTLFLLLAIALIVPEALSQQDSTLTNFSLKELLNLKVVTVSKTSQNLETAPATVIVITREQIKSRGYQSLLDVMYDLPDVKVDDKIYSGIRNSFTVRGTQGSEKMVIMMDGIIISSPSGEAMPIMENYPVNVAEQIEVVYGPASALYGANAVSAVINIITRKPFGRKKALVEVSSIADPYGYTNTTLFLSKRIADDVRVTVSGQYFYDRGVDYSKLYKNDPAYNIDSYKDGTFNTIYGPITPVTPVRAKYEAPMKAYNIHAALQVQGFALNFFRNYFEIPTSFGNNTSNALYNKEVFMGQSITMVNATYRKEIGNVTSSTMLTSSQYNLDPRTNYRNLYSNMEPGYKYAATSMIKAEQQLDFKVSDKLQLTTGVSYEHYSSIPQSGDLDAPIKSTDYLHGVYLGTKAYYRPEGLAAQFYLIKFHNVGSYAQAQYSPLENLHFTIGGRFDWNSRYGNTVNPRMGIVYAASEKTTIKAMYGTAFLAPTPSDSYSQYGSFYTPDSGRTYGSYFLHLPNPGLKPIISKNIELSVRQHISDHLIVTVNGYFTALSSLHAFSDDNESTNLYNNLYNGIPVDYIEVFTNNNRQKNIGGSFQINAKHRLGEVHLNTFFALSYVTGRVEDGLNEQLETSQDTETDFTAPFMTRLGTDLKIGKFSISPRLILMGKQHIAGIADTTGWIARRQHLPGYVLLNVSARYAVSKHVSGFVNVINALDQRYRAVGFNMDLTNTNTDLFQGVRQDPIRIRAGINWEL